MRTALSLLSCQFRPVRRLNPLLDQPHSHCKFVLDSLPLDCFTFGGLSRGVVSNDHEGYPLVLSISSLESPFLASSVPEPQRSGNHCGSWP